MAELTKDSSSPNFKLNHYPEQREIVAILYAIDRKIDLHNRKRAVIEDLSKALLHNLMTGKIRVGELDLGAMADSTTLVKKAPDRVGERT